MADVTVIIPTFNEASNLAAALDSLAGWAETVFVVDSYSTDETVEVALSRAADGVRVVQHPFENYSSQWNWALDRLPITSSWTMKLDADERVTRAFKEDFVAFQRIGSGDFDGLLFRRRTFFMGAPLRWGGASSTYVLHLWRTGKARFENRPINEHVILDGRAKKVRSGIDHHSEKSLTDWISKHNRYASLEARSTARGNLTGDVNPRLFGSQVERRMWLKKVHSRLPGRNVFYFIYQYIVRLGFLDGRPGFRYAFLRAAFLYWIDLKLAESRATGQLPEIAWPERGQPHGEVAASELQSRVDSDRPPART